MQLDTVQGKSRIFAATVQQLERQLQQEQTEMQHINVSSLCISLCFGQDSNELKALPWFNTMRNTAVVTLQDLLTQKRQECRNLHGQSMHTDSELRQSQRAQQSLQTDKKLLQQRVEDLEAMLKNRTEASRQSLSDVNDRV